MNSLYATRPTDELDLAGAAKTAGVHISALYRWVSHGLRSVDGTRVRLRARRIGGRWRVRPADLDDFFDRLGGAPVAEAAPAAPTIAARAAAAELDRMGIR